MTSLSEVFLKMLRSWFFIFAVCSATHIDETELPSASINPVGSEIVVFDVDADGNNNTLELNCTGDGDLRWYRGDFESLPDNAVILLNNETLSLKISPIINNTDATHDGIPYFCVANNSLGSARSRTKLIKFAFFDGFEVQNTTTLINVTIMQPVAISCGVRNAAPPPIIVWYKDNEVLDTTSTPDKIRTLDDGNTLVIYNLEHDDITSNGSPVEYKCGVTNVRMFETVNSTEVFNLVEETFDFLAYHRPMDVTVTISEAEAGVTFYYIAATDGDTRILPHFSGSLNFDTFSVVYMGSKTMSLDISILRGTGLIDGSQVSFTMTVIEPLVVIERPSELFNTTNVFHRFAEESISFTCNATGTGVQVQWYHNADLLDVSTSVLNFANLTANQSGVYQCLWEESADGSFASDTWALVVQTPVPPNNISITSSGPNYGENHTIVPPGEDVTLTLVFIADTLPNVTWKFNKEVIELVNNTGFNVTGPFEISEDPNRYKIVFTIRNISASNSGLYYATIEDGRTDPVIGPVWFVYQEVPINIISFNITTPYDCLLDDTEISLWCIVEGLPEPVVTYRRGSDEFTCDGMSCDISTEVNEFVTTRILTFDDPMRSDQGMYACSAVNDVSNPITQNLFDDDDLLYCAFPRILNTSNNISILEGGDVLINCTIESSPDAVVKWYKDGVQVIEADRIDIQIEDGNRQDVHLYELIIRNVVVSDSAVYMCSANNTIIPSSVNATITLTVTNIAFPCILNSSNNISVLEGADVLINCTIESSPDAVVTWYKDGVLVTEADNSRIDIQIEDDDRQDVHLYELIIRNVTVSDSAVYMCSANNTIIPSSVSATITLTVNTEESQETITESTTTLPIWAAVTIGMGGGVLLILVAIVMIILCFMLNTSKNKESTGQVLSNPAYDDCGTVNNTRISSDGNSNKKISVNKNPAYQDIHSVQTNTPDYDTVM